MLHRTRKDWRLAAPSIALMIFASCSQPVKPAAEKATQLTFASPAEAGTAFLAAATSGDQAALEKVFGPDAKDVLFSGDPIKDKNDLAGFVQSYNTMNRWLPIKAGGQILAIGADNYLFPVPLQQDSSGQWYFNSAAGKDEILARRIGRDELVAIAACSSLANAQQKYFKRERQYARQFGSDEGKQNGLYWRVSEGQPESPLGELGEFAKAAGYTSSGEKPQPFDGYYFRILTKQGDHAEGGAKDYIVNEKLTGGFAILAYPAEYRSSGIMTFLVGKDGVVYQKDLGEAATKGAVSIAEYNPGDGWKPAI